MYSRSRGLFFAITVPAFALRAAWFRVQQKAIFSLQEMTTCIRLLFMNGGVAVCSCTVAAMIMKLVQFLADVAVFPVCGARRMQGCRQLQQHSGDRYSSLAD